MPRLEAIQDKVLIAVRDHLQTDLALNESQCYLTIDPMNPKIAVGGDYWLAVAPGDGRFDEDIELGGVVEQCLEDSVVSVWGYSRIHVDQTNHDEMLLTDPVRGILAIKRKILKSLSGVDLTIEGEPFQRALLMPSYAHAPEVGMIDLDDDAALPIAIVGVQFRSPFDWDLYS